MQLTRATSSNRLLVVQKDAPIAKAMARLMRAQFADVDLASSPGEAERVLARAPDRPTVIVCGERFAEGEPGGSAWIADARARHPQICRVILATAEPCGEAPPAVDATIAKPFDPDAFRRSVLGPATTATAPARKVDRDSLAAFIDQVYLRMLASIAEHGFESSQLALLERTLERPRAAARLDPFGDPLSLVYLIAKAHGRAMDQQATHVGAFALLYMLSLDLFDDVQDDDLAGKPHEGAGAPIAINNAITLLLLAGRELQHAIAMETNDARRLGLLDIYTRAGIAAVGGQHRDLLGQKGASTPDEVLAMQVAKTSSVAMLTECGALLGGAIPENVERFARLGRSAAMFIQVRDDLRDVFGKDLSPDLMTGKWTYPMACFWEDASAEARAELSDLTSALPTSIRAIRSLFYRSGAVERSASKLEELRTSIHAEVGATQVGTGYLRTVLSIFDGLAATVYTSPKLEGVPVPKTGFHGLVQEELTRFQARMGEIAREAGVELPSPPALSPWHRPQWMYVPAERTIFYPDLEDLSAELLPFQAFLLGTDDLDEVRDMMIAQLRTVLAHEMFHFLRDTSLRLTTDHWHEEWVANRLAMAYTQRFAPPTARATGELARTVIARFPEIARTSAPPVLDRCREPSEDPTGYDMELLPMAVVTMAMLEELLSERLDLVAEARALLSQRVATSVAVAGPARAAGA